MIIQRLLVLINHWAPGLLLKKNVQHAGKCGYQQSFKGILDTAVVYTPEEVTDVSPSFRITQTTDKN